MSALNHRKKWAAAPFLLGFLLAFSACRKDPQIPENPGAVGVETGFYVPAGWPAPHYSFANNPLKPEIIKLGKKLFNDPALSRDSTISCGSCHQPAGAFSQTGHVVSHGVAGRLGTRNSPGLFNLAWHPTLMWDGGANNMETQILIPLQSHEEMELTPQELVARVSATLVYQKAFLEAWGTPEINLARILKTITQFMATLISDNAKWDRVQRGQARFTAEEAAGEKVFNSNCASCHKPPLFSDFSFRSNGISAGASNDSGRMRITGALVDKYKFKVPSLRNWAFSAPYFHDGRAGTLVDVLAHYTEGIAAQPVPYTDPQLHNGVRLDATEKEQLKAFLQTLNDTAFTQNMAYR